VSLPARFRRSTLIVLNQLTTTGPMCPDQIITKSGLSPRSVTYALKDLLRFKICRRVPNLNDMRKPLYEVDRERMQDIERQIEVGRASTRAMIR